MISSFEVGTVFKIVDRASPVIKELTRNMLRLQEASAAVKETFKSLGTMGLGNLNRSVTGLTDQALKMQSAYDKAFDHMQAGTDASIKQAQALAAEWRGVSASMTTAAAAAGRVSRATVAGGIGGGGRGGASAHSFGGGGMHIGSRFGLPGGTHASFFPRGGSGMAGMVGLGALGYGAYQEALIQQQIVATMMATGQTLGNNAMGSDFAKQMHSRIMSGALETGMSPVALAESSKFLFTQMNGMPNQQILNYMPDAFRFAAFEKAFKGVSPQDSMKSLTGLLHMSGSIDPEKMNKIMGQFAFASTISPLGLPGIERAASYALPFATTAGIDPGSLLLVIAQAQSAGILSGKAGTWFQGMLQNLSPKGGFASLLTSRGGRQRIQGLQQLGLVGQNGNPTGLNLIQQNDWVDFIKTVHDHLEKIPENKRMGVLYQAMGSTQAARGLSTLMLPNFIKLLPELQKEQKLFAANPNVTLSQFIANNPVMKVEQDLQKMNKELIDLGTVVLPPVVTGLGYLSTGISKLGGVITSVLSMLPGGGARAQAIEGAAGGGAVAGAIVGAGIGSFVPGVGTVIGGGIGAGFGGLIGGAVGAATSGPAATPSNQGLPVGQPGQRPGSGVKSRLNPLNGLFQNESYTGGSIGGSGLLQNAMFTTSAGGSSGFQAASFGGDVGAGPAGSGMGLKPGSSPMGGSGPSEADVAGLTGNAYIKKLRSGFATELQDPKTRLKMMAMLATEGDPIQTAESAMNRANFSHKSLSQILSPAFYGPMRNPGHFAAVMAQISRDPKKMARYNAAIDAVLAGSNTIHGATDQGMVSDPNGGYILRHFHLWGKNHGNIFGDWNGGRGTKSWRENFESHAGQSADLPPEHKAQDNVRPVILKLDGRTIARSTMAHMVEMGNGPARAPRMADYTAVRPINA